MKNKPVTYPLLLLAVLVLAGWFALAAQFYINVSLKQHPLAEIITRYFSYFTILTNLLVAICYTCLLVSPGSAAGRFFSRQQTLAAVTVYIIIVGLIYNSVLRFLWNPQGLQAVVDELLHSVIPVLAFICWLLYAPKDKLQWKDIFSWLIYPLVYLGAVLARGSVSGFYPYPFIDRTVLGLNKVLVNAAGITLLFTAISFVFVAIGRKIGGKQNSRGMAKQ